MMAYTTKAYFTKPHGQNDNKCNTIPLCRNEEQSAVVIYSSHLHG